MIASFLYKLLQAALLLLAQGLILNHVNILGYATPMPFIYFILTFQRGTGRKTLLLSGFLMGLASDMFANTPGISASACTLLAMLQPSLLDILAPRDSAEDLLPSFSTMGVGPYFRYLFVSTLLFLIVYYLLAIFSLAHPIDILINIAGGTLFTLLIMLGIASFQKKKA
ncbi:MAG: rod shape-determining protein MreD [Bacteroidaceae bacterium]|nr:rod shape-determining protein MreD [Bacteroidaceae bacterium]